MKDKKQFPKALLVFLLCFIPYNLNFREVFSNGTLSAQYLPVSIIREGNLDLGEFPLFQYRRMIPEKRLRYGGVSFLAFCPRGSPRVA